MDATGPADVREENIQSLEQGLIALFRRGSHPRLHQRMAAGSGVELPQALYVVLGQVADHGPIRVSNLAAALGVDDSTASRQAGRLVDRELLAREADPEDGRACRLAITHRGRELVSRQRQAWRETLADLVSDWSDEELENFAGQLDALVENLLAFLRDEPA